MNPDSPAVDAVLLRHIEVGRGQLDLTKQNSPSPTQSSAVPTATRKTPHPIDLEHLPLQPYQRLIIAHAIFCTAGFLVFLPAGALIGRYLRTFTPVWYKGHWITQFAFGRRITTFKKSPIYLTNLSWTNYHHWRCFRRSLDQ